MNRTNSIPRKTDRKTTPRNFKNSKTDGFAARWKRIVERIEGLPAGDRANILEAIEGAIEGDNPDILAAHLMAMGKRAGAHPHRPAKGSMHV